MSSPADNMIADLAERDFIVFAGAGIPNESNAPITWKKLLVEFKIAEPELVTLDIDKVGEDGYPDCAQEIFEALHGKYGEDRYYEILSGRLKATSSDYSGEQRDIIETAKHVVTTNFDGSFGRAMERELEGKEYTHAIQSLPDLRLITLNTEYSVSYLHGSTGERCIVFKTDDYTTFYPSQSQEKGGNDNLEQFLRHLYEERTIVFIGVSFNDKYVLNAMRAFYNRVKQNDGVGIQQKGNYELKLNRIQHYALMNDNIGIESEKNSLPKDERVEQLVKEEREKKIKSLEEMRIKVVTYQQHVEWTNWFRILREKKRRPSKIGK